MAQAVGLDGMAYLEEEDMFKVMVYGLLTNRAMELKDEWNERLAIAIVNAYGKARNG